MRKLACNAMDDQPRRRGARSSFGIALLIVLILSPLLYETTLVCVSGWKSLLGVSMPIKTPILDAIGAGWEATRHEIHAGSRRYFHEISWKPSYVIPFALFWTGVLALSLRKC